jgi:hypothetical protein
MLHRCCVYSYCIRTFRFALCSAEATSLVYTRLSVSLNIQILFRYNLPMRNRKGIVYEPSKKLFNPVLILLRYEQHVFSQRFIQIQTPISYWPAVAEQYVLRNNKSGVL